MNEHPSTPGADDDGMCHGGPDCQCFCEGCGEHLERCECDDEDYPSEADYPSNELHR